MERCPTGEVFGETRAVVEAQMRWFSVLLAVLSFNRSYEDLEMGDSGVPGRYKEEGKREK